MSLLRLRIWDEASSGLSPEVSQSFAEVKVVRTTDREQDQAALFYEFAETSAHENGKVVIKIGETMMRYFRMTIVLLYLDLLRAHSLVRILLRQRRGRN